LQTFAYLSRPTRKSRQRSKPDIWALPPAASQPASHAAELRREPKNATTPSGYLLKRKRLEEEQPEQLSTGSSSQHPSKPGNLAPAISPTKKQETKPQRTLHLHRPPDSSPPTYE
jgi:hypothetical protein